MTLAVLNRVYTKIFLVQKYSWDDGKPTSQLMKKVADDPSVTIMLGVVSFRIYECLFEGHVPTV